MLDFKHNLETLTDSFLEHIKDAPNLTTLRLPSHNQFSDAGLAHLEASPCAGNLAVFSFESSVIWDMRNSSRMRPTPTYTQQGLKYLIQSMKKLDELCLDISVVVTSDLILDNIIFDRLKRLSVLRLSGSGLVDMKFISRLAISTPRFKVLDLEGSLIEISGISKLAKAVGSTLTEFRICVEDRKTQTNILAGGENTYTHPLVRYAEFTRYLFFLKQ